MFDHRKEIGKKARPFRRVGREKKKMNGGFSYLGLAVEPSTKVTVEVLAGTCD
jgi:hypothetical protein